MEASKYINYRVAQQGAILVNRRSGVIRAEGAKVVCFSIDTRSKRPNLLSTGVNARGAPTLSVSASEDSLLLLESRHRDTPTTLSFPDHVGWTVFLADTGRYSINVSLIDER